MDNIFSVIEKVVRLQTERELAEIVQKYDFIVGSKEAQYALTKALPKDANVVYSPFIEDPNLVYAVKKFDILDVIKAESEDCRNCKKWENCPCGKDGHENGTSQGYSIGECRDFDRKAESEGENDN